MLIAPAGFGKTHTISECLQYCQNEKKQLVLTHTHAGVASIKEKIGKTALPSRSYDIETITSFAQKYSLAFCNNSDIPEQSYPKEYYPFILENAIKFIKLKPIKEIISNTYGRLFVDEYQDCTTKQHELILLLSNILPTHLLGDFLQGIFDFNDNTLVDMTDRVQMGEFSEFKFELDKPQRWLNGNNSTLGEDLKKIRQDILMKVDLKLENYPSIEMHSFPERDLSNPKSDYYKRIRILLKEPNLLLLHPETSNINPRLSLIKLLNNSVTLIESIDDKDFYNVSKLADSISEENVKIKLIEICHKLFNKTGIDYWFNDKGLKNKTKAEERERILPLQLKINSLTNKLSSELLSETIKEIGKLDQVKCSRKELYKTFCRALDDSEIQNISVYDSMVNSRNFTRRIGRKVFGRCIGTTLLTKGLEFDTVVILNAHKFTHPKHLYVALTRASKRLIICTENNILRPNYLI